MNNNKKAINETAPLIAHEVVELYERAIFDRTLLPNLGYAVRDISADDYRLAFIDGLILAAHHLILEGRK